VNNREKTGYSVYLQKNKPIIKQAFIEKAGQNTGTGF